MRKLSTLTILVAGPLVALAFISAPGVSAELPENAYMADGKALFLENSCDKCHSVTAKGVEAQKKNHGDLSKVAEDADFLTKYLKKEVEKETKGEMKKHKKKWKGSDGDLKAIIGWLKS